MSNPIPDPGLGRNEIEALLRLESESAHGRAPRKDAGCSICTATDKLRAALSAPQEEGEGLEAAVDAFLNAGIKWGTYSDRTAILLGLRAAAPALRAEERRRLAGLLQAEIDRLREIEKDCAEVAASAFEKEEGERPLRAELARIQADEAESAAERLESILVQLRIAPALTQQSVPEHSGEGCGECGANLTPWKPGYGHRGDCSKYTPFSEHSGVEKAVEETRRVFFGTMDERIKARQLEVEPELPAVLCKADVHAAFAAIQPFLVQPEGDGDAPWPEVWIVEEGTEQKSYPALRYKREDAEQFEERWRYVPAASPQPSGGVEEGRLTQLLGELKRLVGLLRQSASEYSEWPDESRQAFGRAQAETADRIQATLDLHGLLDAAPLTQPVSPQPQLSDEDRERVLRMARGKEEQAETLDYEHAPEQAAHARRDAAALRKLASQQQPSVFHCDHCKTMGVRPCQCQGEEEQGEAVAVSWPDTVAGEGKRIERIVLALEFEVWEEAGLSRAALVERLLEALPIIVTAPGSSDEGAELQQAESLSLDSSQPQQQPDHQCENGYVRIGDRSWIACSTCHPNRPDLARSEPPPQQHGEIEDGDRS